jgi:hypothetical protein
VEPERTEMTSTGTATAARVQTGEPCKRWGWLDWLCKAWIVLTHERRGGDPCVYVPERIINRPDPLIYSQFLLMQLGQPVTWDNPDVAIFLGGVEQNTYDLRVDTIYDVVIKVHNSSREKPAPGTGVEIRWIEFGAGAQIRHAITSLVTDVPVWPGTVTVATTWRTPATPGHYCIEVELSHPDDGNPANNRGWNNTQVKKAASEVSVPIRIFNRWVGGPPLGAGIERRRRRRAAHVQEPGWNIVEIDVDSYRFEDGKGKQVDPGVMFEPRPPAWPARVEPHLFHFAPEETFRDVALVVDAPDGGREPEPFNVNVRQGGQPTGGVTVLVTPR